MSVSIVTTAFTTDMNAWKVIRRSAMINEARMKVIGVGRGYPHMEVFREVIDTIRQLPDEYVIYTDAYDVMFNRWDEKEAEQILSTSDSGLLVSCNDECWPDGDWCKSYPRPDESPWWSACGGQFGGHRDSVIDLCEEFLDSDSWTIEAGGGNQEILHKMFASGMPASLDRGCRLFQFMGSRSMPYLKMRDEKIFNSYTGTVPMLLHWGGRAPGMIDTYDQMYGEEDRR